MQDHLAQIAVVTRLLNDLDPAAIIERIEFGQWPDGREGIDAYGTDIDGQYWHETETATEED